MSLPALANCVLPPADALLPSTLDIVRGKQIVEVHCNLEQPAVLSFRLDVVKNATAMLPSGESLQRLNSAGAAFFIPEGQNELQLVMDVQRSRYIHPQLETLPEFYARENIHLLMMSGFFGFCIALVVFVGVLGRSINNAGFYAYSAYIASAGVFFFNQEGMFNVIAPGSLWANDLRLKMLLAGLTVFTAMQFITRLLDLNKLLPSLFSYTLRAISLAVLSLGILHVMLPENVTLYFSNIMGLLTLAGILGITAATAYAVKIRVPTAVLVLVSLLLMFFLMVIRLYLHDISPFFHRYGLIVAVTIEAMLLAVAASEKVRRLNDDKTRLFRDATYDSLCPVLNRRGWEAAAEHMIQRHGNEGGVLTLLFIDLDKFKNINDVYGHAAGDEMLLKVASRLRAECGERDLIGRLGGDEFVVLSHCLNRQQASGLFERLQFACRSMPIDVDGQTIKASASVGYCMAETPQKSIHDLLEQADTSMYSHKQAGRGQHISV